MTKFHDTSRFLNKTDFKKTIQQKVENENRPDYDSLIPSHKRNISRKSRPTL